MEAVRDRMMMICHVDPGHYSPHLSRIDDPGPLAGSSCGYAQPESVMQGDKWLKPHVDKQMYCAVNDDLWQGGEGCGKCYKISYNGVGGTDPGEAGKGMDAS